MLSYVFPVSVDKHLKQLKDLIIQNSPTTYLYGRKGCMETRIGIQTGTRTGTGSGNFPKFKKQVLLTVRNTSRTFPDVPSGVPPSETFPVDIRTEYPCFLGGS
ncbi:hypothetical protein L6164_000739 [Bauhinia variegata]|uniref:Uncharacterized protein n=1 Tax=Bauhinia variegata TaxID=167791 RepID=A0ACB9Q818_BAUVA|nr:hypothetical protein L6164_000739 [Bauhinia variegata]